MAATFYDALWRSCFNTFHSNYRTPNTIISNIDNNEILKHTINIEISNTIITPVLIKGAVLEIISQYPTVKNVNIGIDSINSISEYRSPTKYKTALSLIQHFLSNIYYENTLLKGIVDCANGTFTYYGNRGTILLEDYTPLLVIEGKYTNIDGTYAPTNFIINIDSRVYTTNNDPISKVLRNSFIPKCFEADANKDFNFIVSVHPITNMYKTSSIPNIDTISNDSIYKFLNTNVDDLIDSCI